MKRLPDKTNTNRLIDVAGAAVCVLITAAVFFTGLYPVLERREQMQREHQQLNTKRQRAQRLDSAATRLSHHMTRLREAAAKHELRLAPLDRLNHRLSRITVLATDAGLHIERLQPGQRVAGDHYQTVPIKVSGQGAFSDSSAFLRRLHRTMPDVAVAGVRVAGRPDKAPPKASPTFAFDLLWYAAPPQSADPS